MKPFTGKEYFKVYTAGETTRTIHTCIHERKVPRVRRQRRGNTADGFIYFAFLSGGGVGNESTV
jgi:hypothetical protein